MGAAGMIKIFTPGKKNLSQLSFFYVPPRSVFMWGEGMCGYT